MILKLCHTSFKTPYAVDFDLACGLGTIEMGRIITNWMIIEQIP